MNQIQTMTSPMSLAQIQDKKEVVLKPLPHYQNTFYQIETTAMQLCQDQDKPAGLVCPLSLFLEEKLFH